jgi:hypothetical protein
MALYLSDIVSVGGKPGLHKVIGKRPSGLIVETLDDQMKRFPTSLTQKVSFLSDISIYTLEGDEKLAEVLKNLNAKVKEGLQLVDKKNSGEEIRSFFKQVLENFDEEQVYISDILKLVNWYEILKDILDFDALEMPEEEAGEDEESKKSKPAPKRPDTNAKGGTKVQTRAKGSVKKSGNLKSGKS